MIGVVTISFNQARYLQRAIDSVRVASAGLPVKYVVVDGNSTDGSKEIINQNRNHISRTIIEPDRGPSDALNKGFAICNDCEIFYYLNADDVVAEDAFRYATDFFAERPNIDILFGAIRIIDSEDHAFLRARVPDRFSLSRYAIGASNIFQQGTFFRKSAFSRTDGFNLTNRTCWDGELAVDMILRGASFERIRKVLGYFRIHGESITGSGKLNMVFEKDKERLRNKIEAAGFVIPSATRAKILTTCYKFNPRSHLEYLAAR